ncbi:defensin [Caerostris darwini]|uniref:Defensin n=1 Tax=Caerostris darwini TaxID=1538125 RepID=A0AAV4W3L3_9ARAC|nr:defensin [Caerostris darwini]
MKGHRYFPQKKKIIPLFPRNWAGILIRKNSWAFPFAENLVFPELFLYLQNIDKYKRDSGLLFQLTEFVLIKIESCYHFRTMNARVLIFIALVVCAFATVAVEAGFGCPFDQMQCHNHCRSIKYRGGYCTNMFKRTCKCYG